MAVGWRQQCKASCLEHSVDGFESLPSTGQVWLLQKRKWLWWKELVQEDTLEIAQSLAVVNVTDNFIIHESWN